MKKTIFHFLYNHFYNNSEITEIKTCFYFCDFAIVNLSSNFVIEHFRSTDFHTV